MQIDESEEHCWKAQSPKQERTERVSNVTVARQGHSEKELAPSLSTEEGIRIDSNDAHLEKARFPIDETLDPGWKVTDARQAHS
jgi:hypothetical protein